MLRTSFNVLIKNVFQSSGNVMEIMIVKMEVMKRIAEIKRFVSKSSIFLCDR